MAAAAAASTSSAPEVRPHFFGYKSWPSTNGLLFGVITQSHPLTCYIVATYGERTWELKGGLDDPMLNTAPVLFALNNKSKQAIQERFNGYVVCLADVIRNKKTLQGLWSSLKKSFVTTLSLPCETKEDDYKNSILLWAHILGNNSLAYFMFLVEVKPHAPVIRWPSQSPIKINLVSSVPAPAGMTVTTTKVLVPTTMGCFVSSTGQQQIRPVIAIQKGNSQQLHRPFVTGVRRLTISSPTDPPTLQNAKRQFESVATGSCAQENSDGNDKNGNNNDDDVKLDIEELSSSTSMKRARENE